MNTMSEEKKTIDLREIAKNVMDKKNKNLAPPKVVAIGIPSGDMVHMNFMMNLINLILVSATRGIACAVINQKAALLPPGRCMIVDQALSTNAEHLLFLDSDMIFPGDLLVKMLAHKKDIVCLDAITRMPPFKSVVKDLNNQPIDHTKTSGLIKIMWLSTAGLLLSRKVLEEMEPPHFDIEFKEDKKFLGEDYYFGNKARSMGYDIYCDTDLSKKFGHMGTRTYFLPPYKSPIITPNRANKKIVPIK